VGQDVAADVEQDDEVATQATGGVRQPGRDCRGAAAGVDEHRGLAEQLGHAALGEAESARAGGGGPGQGHGRIEALGTRHVVEPARPGEGVDRASLPGDAAEHGSGPLGGGDPGRAHGAGDVTAAADADAKDAFGVAQLRFGGGVRQ
jgi:hypothetical protein